MDLLTPHLSKIRIPTANDKLYKDECVFSFDNPVNNFCYRLVAEIIILIHFLGIRDWIVH